MMSRSIPGLLIAGFYLVSAPTAHADDLVLADGGQSAYRIVVADEASPSTRHAAEELQMFLQQMSGAKLPIVSDREPLAGQEIVLGDNAHLRQLGEQIDFPTLGREGYVLRAAGQRLVIAGGAQRGNLYGVYGLLEDHLGCRWFAPDVSRIPKTPRLVIATLSKYASVLARASASKVVLARNMRGAQSAFGYTRARNPNSGRRSA